MREALGVDRAASISAATVTATPTTSIPVPTAATASTTGIVRNRSILSLTAARRAVLDRSHIRTTEVVRR